jgi:hypothetical protein
MQTLLAKLKKSRQTEFQVGGYSFTTRRLTDFDLGEILEVGSINAKNLCKKCVVGWNLTELDLIPGGDPLPAPFDAELFIEWVSEHDNIWKALYGHIWGDYHRRAGLVEDILGEANAGLAEGNYPVSSEKSAKDAAQAD